MRGKVGGAIAAEQDGGITPACAGKRHAGPPYPAGRGDHPRMCGEKQNRSWRSPRPMGSPPHVRGKDVADFSQELVIGITPACAGKSHPVFRALFCAEDHPRMCGEKFWRHFKGGIYQGSPPHVRGKVAGVLAQLVFIGITPACAGKRLKRSRSIVPHAAIVPLFPSVCNKPAGSDGSPAGHDAPPFLPIENAAPASPAYNLRSL